MTITKSAVYAGAFAHALGKSTAIALNLTATTHKVAMYTNQLNPDFSMATGSAYSATNEVTGVGYTAAGQLLLGTTLTESPVGTVAWGATNTVWTSSTISSARAAIVYADALTPKYNINLFNFGLDYSSTSGTFTIQWPLNGIVMFSLY